MKLTNNYAGHPASLGPRRRDLVIAGSIRPFPKEDIVVATLPIIKHEQTRCSLLTI